MEEVQQTTCISYSLTLSKPQQQQHNGQGIFDAADAVCCLLFVGRDGSGKREKKERGRMLSVGQAKFCLKSESIARIRTQELPTTCGLLYTPSYELCFVRFSLHVLAHNDHKSVALVEYAF